MIASSTKGNKRHPLNICIIGRMTLSSILYSTYFELIKASPKFWFHLPRSKGFVYPIYYNNIYSIQTLKTIDIYQQYSIYYTINISSPVNSTFVSVVTNGSTCHVSKICLFVSRDTDRYFLRWFAGWGKKNFMLCVSSNMQMRRYIFIHVRSVLRLWEVSVEERSQTTWT